MDKEKLLIKLNICLLVEDDELLEKYNKIWNKVRNSIKKAFDNEPVYHEIYLKIKMKSYKGKYNTSFHDDRIPKEGSYCICLSVILIGSVFKLGEKILSSSAFRGM